LFAPTDVLSQVVIVALLKLQKEPAGLQFGICFFLNALIKQIGRPFGNDFLEQFSFRRLRIRLFPRNEGS